MIDNKGKLFGKVSIIDIIIILVVIVGVVLGGKKFLSSKIVPGAASATQKYAITVYWEDSPEFSVKAVKKGDVFFDIEKSVTLGTVSETPKIESSISFFPNAEGKAVKTSKEGYVSYYMTIDSNATKNPDGGIKIGGADYYIGRTINQIRVGNSVLVGRIYNIQTKE